MSSPLSRVAALAMAVGAGALVASSSAAAQGEGVYRDPDSPAGHEYAVPLDQAREEATGRPLRPSSRPSDAAPRFGEGITPARQPPPRLRSSAAQPRSGVAHPGSRRERLAARPPRTADARLAAASVTPDPNIGWAVAVGLGLVASAALLGFGARRLFG